MYQDWEPVVLKAKPVAKPVNSAAAKVKAEDAEIKKPQFLTGKSRSEMVDSEAVGYEWPISRKFM